MPNRSDETVLRVRDFCSDGQAIDANDGERLGEAIVGSRGPVVLDFTGIVVLGSSYANAMFLRINAASALSEAIGRIAFRNIRPLFEQVLAKSKSAVIKESDASPGP